jgi:hypothetical protein
MLGILGHRLLSAQARSNFCADERGNYYFALFVKLKGGIIIKPKPAFEVKLVKCSLMYGNSIAAPLTLPKFSKSKILSPNFSKTPTIFIIAVTSSTSLKV